MALLAEKGTFAGSGSSPQTVTLSDGSLTPMAIILWTTGPGSAGFTSDEIYSIGYGTRRSGSTQSGCVGLFSADGVATSDCVRVRSTTLLYVLSSTSATDYTVSLDSFGAGQFVVSYSSAANASGDTFHYLVFGGSDIADAIVLNWLMDGTTTEVITGTGFQPDMLFALDSDIVNADALTAGIIFSFGAASSNTRYRAIGMSETDGDTATSTMNMNKSFHNTACLNRHALTTDTLDAQWDLDSFDTDGCTLGVINAPGLTNRTSTFLFIKGGTWEVGHKAKITTTGNDTFTLANANLTPKGVLLFGNRLTAITISSGSADIGIGAGTSTDGTKEGFAGVCEVENINTTEDRFFNTDRVYEVLQGGALPEETDEADLTQLNKGNFVINWAVSTASARLVGYVAFGEEIISKVVTDNFYLNDDKIKTKQQVSTDSFYVSDSTITQTIKGIINLIVTDNLLSADLAINFWNKLMLDTILNSDTQVMSMLRQFVNKDNLFIYDSYLKEIKKYAKDDLYLFSSITTQIISGVIERIIADNLMLLDPSIIYLNKVISNNLPINDLFISQKIAQIKLLDKILLADTSQMQIMRNIISVDNIFISDSYLRYITKIVQDRLLLGENIIKSLSKILYDGLLLNDSVVIQRLIDMLLTDNLFLKDYVVALKEERLLDRFLIVDSIHREINKLSKDAMFIDDAFLLQKFKQVQILDNILLSDIGLSQSLRQQFVSDGILLLDFVGKNTEKIVKDQVLLTDSILREFIKMFLDSLSLKDSAITQKIKGLTELILSDTVLLPDAIVKVFSEVFLDKELLGDNIAAQKIGMAISLILTDYMMLRDVMMRMKEGVISDGISLTDKKTMNLNKIILNSMLTLDTVTKELLFLKKEGLILSDEELMQRIRQSQKLDMMYLTDSIVKTIYEYIKKSLVYARLHSLSILGDVVWASQDVMGRDIDSMDFLGRVIGTGPKPRMDL